MGDAKAPERIWASASKQGYGEWQDVTDGLPRPVEYVRADIYAALLADRDAQAEIARLRKVLNSIYENVEYWSTLQISSKIRDALQRKEGDE